MTLAEAIRVILDALNDAEDLLKSLDYNEKQWDDLQDAIATLQDHLIGGWGK